MNCTGEGNRERICREYNIKAVGCIVLFGGRKVISDAGSRVITDKYYKFFCTHKRDGHHEFIQCGYPTAKHICELCGIEIPTEFNPFIGGDNRGGDVGGIGGGLGRPWNRGRRQLYTAIMLFITAKDAKLAPNTAIFKVKERVEKNVYSNVEIRDVKAMNTILGSYHTTLSSIIADLTPYGNVRQYNFNILFNIIEQEGIAPNNYT